MTTNPAALRAHHLNVNDIAAFFAPDKTSGAYRVVRKALLAISEYDGNRRNDKTTNGSQATKIARAKVDVLVEVLIDFPGRPAGGTTFAVEENLRAHLYPTAANVWQPFAAEVK